MSRRCDSCSLPPRFRSPPHLNPFILDHPLHPPDSKVGFAGARLRKKHGFAVLVRDIRTSPGGGGGGSGDDDDDGGGGSGAKGLPRG